MAFKLAILYAVFVYGSPLVALTSGSSYRDGKENFIQQVYDRSGNQLAIVKIKNKNYARKGALLNTYRWARPNDSSEAIKVKTGEIKLTAVNDGMVVGVVAQNGDSISESIFRKHPGVMAGDEVEIKNLQIVARTVVAPETSLRYVDLYQNPSRFNQSFELSDEGLDHLAKVSEIYGHLRTSKLIIEGHTGAEGSSSDNQVESLQRAQSIKHQLVQQFGFDPDRLIALGFGETEPVDEVYYPGVEVVNRRIVFRVSHE